MKDLTSILKRAALVGLTITALSYLPLNAQKINPDNLKKAKQENYCLSNQAKRYMHRVYGEINKQEKKSPCIADSYKRYHKAYHKMIKRRG
jgi:hypothetical protein